MNVVGLNLSFRKAVPVDADTIVAIVNSAYRGESSRKGWTTEADLLTGARTVAAEIIELINAQGSVILLAEANASAEVSSNHGSNHRSNHGSNTQDATDIATNPSEAPTIIGSVHLSKTDDNGECAGYFGMFAINPDLQAGGFGKQMIREAELFVQREWNANKMVMEVIPVRHELIAFYERRGYRLTGKVKPFPVNPELWLPKAQALQLARMEKRFG